MGLYRYKGRAAHGASRWGSALARGTRRAAAAREAFLVGWRPASDSS